MLRMTSGFPLSRERQEALAIKFLPSYPYVPILTLLRDSEIQEWRLFQHPRVPKLIFGLGWPIMGVISLYVNFYHTDLPN